MLLYILKSATCLAILLAFYKIFLERENMHTFKRFYLLGSLLAAFAIPFITFVEYVEIPVVTQIIEPSNSNVPLVSNVGQEQSPTNYLPSILWSIYGIGIVVFGFNFIKNLHQIIQRIQKNPKYKINRITNVLLLDRIIPHTFFNYIFLNKKKFEAKEIPSEVLLHEETHALQKHSLDVLLVELLQVLFWFNPLIYFTKKAIKLNHEFLADKAVINNGVQPTLYQQILLEFSSNSTEPLLANAINYSSIKKRFTVMKTKTSKKGILIRSLLLLTLLTTLVYGFSQKKILEIHSENNQEILGSWIDEEQESIELSFFEQDGGLMFDGGNSKPIRVQILNGEYYYVSPKARLKLPDWRDKLPVHFDSEKGFLTYRERKYIPIEKSNKGKLYGNWVNKKEGIKFIVHHSGNEIVWDVIKADGKPVRYYPKKQGDRYAFTYGKELELWSFKTENGILYDSRGQSYNRVQELQSEEIIVKINKKGQLLVQAKNLVALEDLKGFLLKFNRNLTKEQRSNIVRAVILPDADAPTGVIKKVDAILSDYGVAQINIVGPEKYTSPTQEIEVHEGTTNSQIKEYNTLAKKYNAVPIEKRKIPLSDLKILESVYRKMNESQKKKAQPFPECLPKKVQDGATKKQIKEYNVLANKYNRELSDAKNIQIKKSEVERLEYLHGLMTHEQKENAEPFPNFPEPPPAPKEPKKPKAPKAPKVKKGEKSDIPPPPPSASNLSEVEVANKVIDDIIAHQDPYDLNPMPIKALKGEMGTIPPTSPVDQMPVIEIKEINEKIQGVKSVKGEVDTARVEPPVPPEPKSPMDHMVDMAKKDATFYLEGKEISSDKAIAILKKNKKINIRTRHEGLKKPIVELSIKPIVIKK